MRGLLRGALFVAFGSIAALGGAAAPASAATEFSPTYTLATGWTCAGDISAVAIPGPSDYSGPGETAVYLRGAFWTPVPGSHQSGCSTTATVDWRNLDTGATGSIATVVAGGPSGERGAPARVLLPTGFGRIEATVTTAPLANLPGRCSFTV